MLAAYVLLIEVITLAHYFDSNNGFFVEYVPLYLVFVAIAALVPLFQCFSANILVAIFDSVFYRKNLTIVEIVRVVLPCNLIYTYLYSFRELLWMGYRLSSVYAVALCFCFAVSLFVLQRKAFQYSKLQAGALTVTFVLISLLAMPLGRA